MILNNPCFEFKWGQSGYFEIKIKFKISTLDYERECERAVKCDFFEQINLPRYCYIQYLVVTHTGLGCDRSFIHVDTCEKDLFPINPQHRLPESHHT